MKLNELKIISEAQTQADIDIKPITILPEFEEVTKKMKFVSTPTEKKNGTLVFDTGIKAIGHDGNFIPGTSYCYKIYADGQIRAQMKGLKISPAKNKNEYETISSHYRLGKPVQGKDVVDMYKNALIDISKRYDKKTKNQKRDVENVKNRFEKWMLELNNINFEGDATED